MVRRIGKEVLLGAYRKKHIRPHTSFAALCSRQVVRVFDSCLTVETGDSDMNPKSFGIGYIPDAYLMRTCILFGSGLSTGPTPSALPPLQHQKISRRLWRSRRRKSSSVPESRADFPAAVLLARKCPNLGRDSVFAGTKRVVCAGGS